MGFHGGSGFVPAIKAFKNMGKVLIANSGSVIRDGDPNPIPLFFCGNGHSSVSLMVIDRVAYQVIEENG